MLASSSHIEQPRLPQPVRETDAPSLTGAATAATAKHKLRADGGGGSKDNHKQTGIIDSLRDVGQNRLYPG